MDNLHLSLYRKQPHLGSLLPHIGIGSLERILYIAIKYGILDLLLQLTYDIARFNAEKLHHIFTGNRILEVSNGILGLDLHQLNLDQFKVGVKTSDLSRILGCDVSIAEKHQVIYIVASIE